MTSHELANELLALPDFPVVNSDGAEVDSIESDSSAGEIVLFTEDDDDDETEEVETLSTADGD